MYVCMYEENTLFGVHMKTDSLWWPNCQQSLPCLFYIILKANIIIYTVTANLGGNLKDSIAELN